MANYEILGKDNGKHVVLVDGLRKQLTDDELEALDTEPEAPAAEVPVTEPEAPADPKAPKSGAKTKTEEPPAETTPQAE